MSLPRKGVSLLLSAALLAAPLTDSLAVTVAGVRAVQAPGAGVGAAGAVNGVSSVRLGNAGLTPSVGLQGTGILPGVSTLSPELSPQAGAGVSLPASVPQAEAQRAHALSLAPSALPGAVLRAESTAPASPSQRSVPAIGSVRVVANAAPAANTAPARTGVAAAVKRVAAGIGVRLKNPFGAPARSSSLLGGRRAAADGDAYKNDPPYTLPETWDKALPPPADAPKSLAEVSLEPAPGTKYTPSPVDWRDEVFYSIMIDRFERGEDAKPYGNPESGHTWHGGNIKGITKRLDYIKEGGYTALLITPILLNALGAYHGYWPLNLMGVDPHFGTMDDFKELVREAHRRGIKIVFDLALNHVGKVFEYEGDYDYGPRTKKIRWLQKFAPSELAKDEHFYRRGVITDWSDDDQALRGDFPPDLRHFNFENPETRRLLIEAAKWWIKETDIDGFRVDAYRHLHPAFRMEFNDRVHHFASRLGKRNFFLLGEISTGKDEDITEYVGMGKLHGVYNYPAYRRENAALHGKAPTHDLETSLRKGLRVFGDGLMWFLRFIDGHDLYRFLRSGTPLGLLHVAMAHMFFAMGMPVVYYGTEQAFRQAIETMAPEGPHLPADPRNREDMFADGRYVSDSSRGEKFDQGSPTYRFIRKLADVRRRFPALRRGKQFVRWSEPGGAGLYAFSRIHDNEEVLVALNFSGEQRTAQMWVDGVINAPGSEFNDALDQDYATGVYSPQDGQGSRVRVTVPAYGVRVLKKN